ncbi:MAG: hypothetical protein H6767_03345 [Candidatus Peribacteria bacterium]|nr:MAG: hypothetical protein H6767_03345 [Candidatus Peribacteria bacterium]
MFMWAYYQMRGDPNFFNSASNQYLLNAFAENPDVVNEGGWSLYLKRTLLDYLENNGFGKLDGNYRETVFSI